MNPGEWTGRLQAVFDAPGPDLLGPWGNFAFPDGESAAQPRQALVAQAQGGTPRPVTYGLILQGLRRALRGVPSA
ncbi:hypothetical protein ACFOZ9_15480 [Deinococcus navajonensis]|uniref:Uncharacterized protein n=1 Tax=Deinococcus navajonensis TaxID=309884 RepID=A0ABV8XRV5_9DEIO